MKIPKRLLNALALVKDGADVHSYQLAKDLRELQSRFPSVISIGPLRMYQGDGTGIVPYFGAIATANGKRALRELR
jgi:hypothetical protein